MWDEDHSQALRATIMNAIHEPPTSCPPQLIEQARMDERMDAGLDTFAW